MNSCVLDARKHGSVQCRRRLFVVAVRKDIALLAGEFTFPAPLAPTHVPPPVSSVFDPVESLAPQPPTVQQAVYTALPARTHEAWYQGPLPIATCASPSTIGCSLYSSAGAACTIKAQPQANPASQCGGVYLDTRFSPPVQRVLSVSEALRVQSLPPSLLPANTDRDTAFRLIGNAIDGVCADRLCSSVVDYLHRCHFNAASADNVLLSEGVSKLLAKATAKDPSKWPSALAHPRFGFMSDEYMRKLGYKPTGNFCHVSALSKARRKASPRPLSPQIRRRGQLVSCDISGPYPCPSKLGGYRFLLGFIDHHARSFLLPVFFPY